MSEGFVQRNGSLPYIEGTPNASAFKEPYPYFEFRQDDDLPYIVGTPESYAFEFPTPYALYMQKDGMYNGLPYLNFPSVFPILSPPYPDFLLDKQKFTIPCSEIFKLKRSHSSKRYYYGNKKIKEVHFNGNQIY